MAFAARVLAAEPAKHALGPRLVKPTGCVHQLSLAEIQTTSVAENLWQAAGRPVSAMVRGPALFIRFQRVVEMPTVVAIPGLRSAVAMVREPVAPRSRPPRVHPILAVVAAV